MPPKTTTVVQPPTPVASKPASFDPAKYVNKNMTIETVNKLKQVFDLFDADHSGQISIPQIYDTIKALGQQTEAKNIISVIQTQTTADQLDFQAFIDIFGHQQTQSQSSLKQLYDMFDPNGTNCFGPEDFERVCDVVGEKFTAQQVDYMIDYADKDRDGGISYEEFVATVTKEYPKV